MKEFDEQNEELELEEDDEVLGVDEEIMRNHNEVSEEFPGLDVEEPGPASWPPPTLSCAAPARPRSPS